MEHQNILHWRIKSIRNTKITLENLVNLKHQNYIREFSQFGTSKYIG